MKLPPHDIQAEQAVLGSILIGSSVFSRIRPYIRDESFYAKKHRIIFRAMERLYELNEPLDLVTVSEALKEVKKFHSVGSDHYLAELAESVPYPHNVEYYAKIVNNKYMLRDMIEKTSELCTEAYAPEANVTSLVERGIESFLHYQSTPVTQSTSEVLAEITDEFSTGKSGIKTGITRFDDLTGGLHNGDLVVVAGRPSMGKTAMTITWADYWMKHGTKFGFVSLEMSHKQVFHRLLSMESNIPLECFTKGKLNYKGVTYSIEEYQEAANTLHKHSPLIYDRPSTPGDLQAAIMRMKAMDKVQVVVIDYLTQVIYDGRENQDQSLSSVCIRLKNLAKQLNIPIVLVSQLNRGVEGREEKRPILRDLRGSGGIEENADMVVFLYRQGYYDQLAGKTPSDDTAEMIIAKNRNGQTGVIRNILWQPKYARFVNAAAESDEQAPF